MKSFKRGNEQGASLVEYTLVVVVLILSTLVARKVLTLALYDSIDFSSKEIQTADGGGTVTSISQPIVGIGSAPCPSEPCKLNKISTNWYVNPNADRPAL